MSEQTKKNFFSSINQAIMKRVPQRSCPYMIVPTHVCAQTRLSPHTFVPRHVCPHARLYPDTFVARHINFVPSRVCEQTRLCPDTLAPQHELWPDTIMSLDNNTNIIIVSTKLCVNLSGENKSMLNCC